MLRPGGDDFNTVLGDKQVNIANGSQLSDDVVIVSCIAEDFETYETILLGVSPKEQEKEDRRYTVIQDTLRIRQKYSTVPRARASGRVTAAESASETRRAEQAKE